MGVVTPPSLCHNTSPAQCHQANARINKLRERERERAAISLYIYIQLVEEAGEDGELPPHNGEQNREEKH